MSLIFPLVPATDPVPTTNNPVSDRPSLAYKEQDGKIYMKPFGWWRQRRASPSISQFLQGAAGVASFINVSGAE